MNEDDRVYEALMHAGHRPNDIDAYEIAFAGLLFADDGPSGADVAVESFRARQRGAKLQPKPAVLTDELRIALEASRRARAD